MKQIGKVLATERAPTTIDEFHFWTKTDLVLKPFDVVKVNHHVNKSITFGVVEEISHFTDSPSFLSGYISSDFGDVNAQSYTQRIGMNYVKAKVVGNSENIYIPVKDGSLVSIADEEDVKKALGLDGVKNPLPCGYIKMYEAPYNITVPVQFNSHFLIGPEGAHLNISGISGLAAKTSYAMFLMKAIQDKFSKEKNESVAYVIMNVKGRDLLAIDEPNAELTNEDKAAYESLGVDPTPFTDVKYFYPFSRDVTSSTYGNKKDIESQKQLDKAFFYKYIFEDDKDSLDLLFSNVDDPNQTMESIVNHIVTEQGGFSSITNWGDLLKEIKKHTESGRSVNKEISVLSWRKFFRLFRKTIEKTTIFQHNLSEEKNEVRLHDSIMDIQAGEAMVIDIAKLDEETQGFVFGDVIRAVYDLKLGQSDDRDEKDIPSKVVVFIDELNKYASREVPKNSPILRQILDITERGRSLGIILFSAEQFKSNIHVSLR